MEPRGPSTWCGSVLRPSSRSRTSTFKTLSPSAVGTFDIVLFTVLLYHMRHPLLALERAASVSGDLLILETVLDATEVTRAGDGLLPRCRAEARSKQLVGSEPALCRGHAARCGLQANHLHAKPIPRKLTIFDRVKRNPPSRRAASFTPAEVPDSAPRGCICCSAMDLAARIA